MLILPAIDLKDGEAVRLYKGDYNQKTVYSHNPEELALQFEKMGAKYLHIVDLDGAKDGKCVNLETIKKIRNNVSIPIELGGGIRDSEKVEFYLEDIGINRIIFGTVALNQPEFLKEMVAKYGAEKIVVGVDVKDNFVSVSGWQTTSKIHYIDFIKEIEKIGIKYIVATDISKDGTLTGPNFELYENISKISSINIIVSGGIKNAENIYQVKDKKYYGCIVGKAYYEKKINLMEVIKCLEKE